MGFVRGFKSQANKIVDEVRSELGESSFVALKPQILSESLGIEIVKLSEFLEDVPTIKCLLTNQREVFSAVTVFAGSKRTIIHNDSHAFTRQTSNITHELSHALLHHPPTPALDDNGCRYWNQDIEDEATWLSGALLVPEVSAIAIARGRWTIDAAAHHFEVSKDMIRYRLNITGATKRSRRAGAMQAI